MIIEKYAMTEIAFYSCLMYLGVLNIIGFVYMAVDKRKAINESYRIPERKLFSIAWLGGGVGIFLAMKLVRHKTLHNSFRYGIPFIIVITYAAAYYLYAFLNNYVMPSVTSLLDQAEQGGILTFVLYPFLIDRGTTGSDIYWSSLWIVITISLLRGVMYYLHSKQIAWPYRFGLIVIHIYASLLLVYKCIFGVINADSIVKAIVILALALGNYFISGFIFGFIDGAGKGLSRKKGVSQPPLIRRSSVEDEGSRMASVASETEEEVSLLLPAEALNNPAKYGIFPTGPIRLESPTISEAEKAFLPLFGTTLYQGDHHPVVCEADVNKGFYKAGINVGYEITHARDLTNEREMEINSLEDILTVHHHVTIGDELIFRVLVGRGTIDERTQDIYMKIESHIKLVK